MGFSRLYYGGFGLLVVALGLLLLPRWMSSGDHPLVGLTDVDVCAKLGDLMRTGLPETPVQVETGIRGQKQSGMDICYAELPGADGAAAHERYVWVSVTTQRQLSKGAGRGVATDRYVDTWLSEVKASGSTVTPVKGAWRRGALIHPPGSGRGAEVLVDDAGVMLLVKGVGVADNALVALADAAARRLRGR
jgi:hypothetical protein